jgi:PEP-CTERM motif
MKYISTLAFALICASTAAHAQVTTYTSSADFHAANPDAVLIEDFENVPLAVRDARIPSYQGPNGLIGFLALPSQPYESNIVIAGPGYDNFGAGLNPTTSTVLTSSNIEHYVGILQVPVTSLGFDLWLNDSPSTLSFFNGDTLLATLNFDTPPVFGQNLAFAGIFSSEGVTSFEWQTTSDTNTGLDNIYAGPIPGASPSGVPEPSTWAMMLFGFGAIGVAMRRRPKPIAQRA